MFCYALRDLRFVQLWDQVQLSPWGYSIGRLRHLRLSLSGLHYVQLRPEQAAQFTSSSRAGYAICGYGLLRLRHLRLRHGGGFAVRSRSAGCMGSPQ